MVHKRLLRPERLRAVPSQFSWLDHRLVRERYLERCSTEALALYLLLVTVADAQGLSYYGDASVRARLRWQPGQLDPARQALIDADLIAYWPASSKARPPGAATAPSPDASAWPASPSKKPSTGSTGPGPKKSTASRSCTCSGCGSSSSPATSCSSAASASARTHLAIALGLRACEERYSVLFASAVDAVNTLAAAQATGQLKLTLNRYLRPRVLILDELATCPSTKPAPTCCSRSSASATSAAPPSSPPIASTANGPKSQQRRHAHVRRARPSAAPRANRRHRGQKLPHERCRPGIVTAIANRSRQPTTSNWRI